MPSEIDLELPTDNLKVTILIILSMHKTMPAICIGINNTYSLYAALNQRFELNWQRGVLMKYWVSLVHNNKSRISTALKLR